MYLDDIAQAIFDIGETLPERGPLRYASETMPDTDRPLYRLYAVLCLAKGTATTAADVHNAWVAWAAITKPMNRWLCPFGALPVEVQQQDYPFQLAIHQVARELARQDREDAMSEPSPVYATLTTTAREPCAHAGCFRTADLDGLCLVCAGRNCAATCGPTPQPRPLGVAATAQAVEQFAALRADTLALADAIRGFFGYGARADAEQVMALARGVRERWGPATYADSATIRADA